MLHRSVAWSGHIGTRCRAPYGSGASVYGGVVEKPPHNTLACARVRMRDAHKWGVERMVGTRIIRAARAGRPGGQTSPPPAITHYTQGGMVFANVPLCTTRGTSICHYDMLFTGKGVGIVARLRSRLMCQSRGVRVRARCRTDAFRRLHGSGLFCMQDEKASSVLRGANRALFGRDGNEVFLVCERCFFCYDKSKLQS